VKVPQFLSAILIVIPGIGYQALISVVLVETLVVAHANSSNASVAL
jgi:hypothetical protein